MWQRQKIETNGGDKQLECYDWCKEEDTLSQECVGLFV